MFKYGGRGYCSSVTASDFVSITRDFFLKRVLPIRYGSIRLDGTWYRINSSKSNPGSSKIEVQRNSKASVG